MTESDFYMMFFVSISGVVVHLDTHTHWNLTGVRLGEICAPVTESDFYMMFFVSISGVVDHLDAHTH